jgi:hypothetical protein
MLESYVVELRKIFAGADNTINRIRAADSRSVESPRFINPVRGWLHALSDKSAIS